MFNKLTYILAVGALALTACSDDPAGMPDLAVSFVEVAPTGRTLTVGDTMLVTAFPRTAGGTLVGGRQVTWSTDDATIATLQPKGEVSVITAARPGMTQIKAKVEGKTGVIAVTIVAAPLVVGSVEVTPAFNALDVGSQAVVFATARAADGTVIGGRTVTWQSSDPTILTIVGAADGAYATLSAHRAGDVVVTATVGGKQVQRAIRVTSPFGIGSITITPSVNALEIGSQLRLSAIVRANDSTVIGGRTVTWQSSDTSIAAITGPSDGSYAMLTARKAGDVVISASVAGRVAHQSVRVAYSSPVAFMTVTPDSIDAEAGALLEVEAWAYRADGGFIDVVSAVWGTTDSTVATVVSTSGRRAVLRTHRAGNIEVVASAGASSDRAKLRVRTPAQVSRVEIVGASLPGPSMWSASIGRFSAKVYGANGQLIQNYPVAWRVDNPSIIDIVADGSVHARLPGTTRVHATAGGITTSTQLTIYPYPANGLELELRAGSDPYGNPRVLVPVGKSTWTDANGVAHEASKHLTSGLLTIGGATPGYQQRLDYETVVSLPNEPWKVIARDTVTLSGTVKYNMLDPLSELRLMPGTPNAAEVVARFLQPGRLEVRQQLGVAPLLDYYWEVR